MKDDTVFDAKQELELATARGKGILKTVEGLLTQTADGKNQAAALLAAGKIWEIAQAYSQARRDYLKALELDAELLEAKARVALVELKMGFSESGLHHARALSTEHGAFRFENISGQPTSSMTVLGDALRINGDIDDATQAYRAALNVDPKDAYAALRLAELLVDQGLTDEAASTVQHYGDLPELAALNSTVRLLKNDPNRLPAIKGVMIFQTRMVNEMAV